MLATIKEAEKYGIPYDVVDDLTGSKLGRAKSATFRTADVVGLDTMAHVIRTMQETLPASLDPFAAHFATPPVLKALVDKGALGQKAKAGFYRKDGKVIKVLDPEEAGLRRVHRQGRRADRPHPEEEGPGRAAEAAARDRSSAGEVPVGHLPRRVPLHRRASRVDRRHRARRRLRAALGLRLVDRSVRDLAGGGLEADRRMGQGRRRRRRGVIQGAAAQVGLRGPGRQGGRRARQGRFVVARTEEVRRPLAAAGLRAADLPRAPGGRGRRDRAHGRNDGVRGRLGATLAPGAGARRRGAGPVAEDQDARDRAGRARRHAQGGRDRRGRLPRPRDLVARRAVLGRCGPAGDAAACS